MNTQDLLDLLSAAHRDAGIADTADFIAYLRGSEISSIDEPFDRLVLSALRAETASNAGIAGHQAAVRRLFPATPADAVTSFCVSEQRGPHPRYIETSLRCEDDQWSITGEKMWGTMAPPATILYVAASTGVVDGQNQLKMVGVDQAASGITQKPLPPERQAGDVPICDLQFDATPIDASQIFEEDAYETFIKPFRLVEDVFSSVATQIGLAGLGSRARLSHELREDLLGLIVQGHAISESTMSAPGDLLLITSYLRSSQQMWQRLDKEVAEASELRTQWGIGRSILTVAARARETRRANAWRALGETLES